MHGSFPWRLLIPVVVVIGIGLTLWSGIFLLGTAKKNWDINQQEVTAHVVENFAGQIHTLTSQLDSLVAVFTASDFVNQQEFSQTVERIQAHQGVSAAKALVGVGYRGSNARYQNPAHPAISVAMNAPLATQLQPKVWQTVVLPEVDLPAEHILLVRPFSVKEGIFGTLYALVDMNQLLPSLGTLKTKLTVHANQNNLSVLTLNRLNNSYTDGQNREVVLSHTLQIIGLDWLFAFHLSPHQSETGPQYLAGLMVLIIGVLMTGTFGWVVWMQQGLADSVRGQVVERTNQLEQAGRRFRLMTDNAYDLIAITAPDGTVEYVNSSFHRVLGFTREELKAQSFMDILHVQDAPRLQDAFAEVLKGRNAVEVPVRCKFKGSGQNAKDDWRYMEAVVKGLHDADWVLKNVVVHMRDVTSRKQFADDLARSEQRFRDFAEASGDWLWEVGPKLNFTYVSPGVTRVLGYEPNEMTGNELFAMLFDQEQDPTRDLIETRVQRHQAYRDIEFWTRSKEGERICLRISGVPTQDDMQHFSGYRGVATNITASKIDREVTYKLATTDHLTGLLNRRRFMEELERSVSLAKRHDTKGVLMFIDLDRFKEINDTHGHEAGDEILRGVTDIFKKCFRSTDIIARLGGDEFAMIMHNIDVPGAQTKVQEVIDRVNAFGVNYKGAKLSVTMSIGMIVYPQEEKMGEELMMAADLAMYRAKDLGRNRMYIDADGTDGENIDSVRSQLKWVNRLRTCLETGDFEMHFQPIVPRDKTHRPLFEALLRIYDEDGKVGSPAIYIDAAEHFGLIQQLDMAVVHRCFETQYKLAKDGVDVDFSINLSSRSLGDTEVMEALRNLLKEYDVDPNRIMFEVTETMALHDPAALRDVGEIHAFINELRGMGFRFAIDDFGAGFTSFQYIRLLPVDVVKIDGAYIKDLETNKEDRIFIESMAMLCRGLHIKTIAEFVENEAIVKILDEIGIDYAQGWHLGKPQADIVSNQQKYYGKVMMDFVEGSTVKALPKAVTKKIASKKPAKKKIT